MERFFSERTLIIRMSDQEVERSFLLEIERKVSNDSVIVIDEKEYDEYKKRIETLGLTFREGRSRIEGEGRSLYFYDYDYHLFELHTGTLSERLKSYDEYNKQHGRV